MSSIGEFLLARIAEDEDAAESATNAPWDLRGGNEWLFPFGFSIGADEDIRGVDAEHIVRYDPARILAECESKRDIIRLHEDWPVLVERELTMEPAPGVTDDLQTMIYRVGREIAWLTESEYIKRFGTEPPAAPMMRALAAVYKEHPDFQEDWS